VGQRNLVQKRIQKNQNPVLKEAREKVVQANQSQIQKVNQINLDQ